MEDKKAKIRGLVYILLGIMEQTTKALMGQEVFANLTQIRKDDLWMEFLFFNLHQFNRTLFAWLGEKERNELMDGVLVELHQFFKTGANEGMNVEYGNLSIASFEDYMNLAYFQNNLKDFLVIYNERESEYAQYSDNSKKGGGLAGTLLWEFGQKITELMDRKNDIAIITKVSFLGTAFTFFADAMKELMETGKVGGVNFEKDAKR